MTPPPGTLARMSPASRRPWWSDLPITQKIIALAAPPILVIFGLVRLVVVRPSGLQLVELLAFVLLGAVLSIRNVRGHLRMKEQRRTDDNPLFEITMRGYRRSDVD